MRSVPLDRGSRQPRIALRRDPAQRGFWLVDRLAERYGAAFKSSSRFLGATAEIRLEGRIVRLLKPHTFMNHSGRAVSAMSHYFRCPAEGILVAHDEIDLPPGILRLKRSGGTGGHRGLEDIVPSLGSRAFSRVRIGVGHPGSASEVIGYVLQRAPRDGAVARRRGDRECAPPLRIDARRKPGARHEGAAYA